MLRMQRPGEILAGAPALPPHLRASRAPAGAEPSSHSHASTPLGAPTAAGQPELPHGTDRPQSDAAFQLQSSSNGQANFWNGKWKAEPVDAKSGHEAFSPSPSENVAMPHGGHSSNAAAALHLPQQFKGLVFDLETTGMTLWGPAYPLCLLC